LWNEGNKFLFVRRDQTEWLRDQKTCHCGWFLRRSPYNDVTVNHWLLNMLFDRCYKYGYCQRPVLILHGALSTNWQTVSASPTRPFAPCLKYILHVIKIFFQVPWRFLNDSNAPLLLLTFPPNRRLLTKKKKQKKASTIIITSIILLKLNLKTMTCGINFLTALPPNKPSNQC
jgi:hypothetical protein